MLEKISLPSPESTSRLAQSLAPLLGPGSTVLLHGPVGAGKTHFARQIISTHLSAINAIEDIPSPTFTLVQTYDIKSFEIWHADLYRLTDISEIYELGLEAAFETCICLIEWPEKLGNLKPTNALTITFEITNDEQRHVNLEWTDDRWTTILNTVQRAGNDGTS